MEKREYSTLYLHTVQDIYQHSFKKNKLYTHFLHDKVDLIFTVSLLVLAGSSQLMRHGIGVGSFYTLTCRYGSSKNFSPPAVYHHPHIDISFHHERKSAISASSSLEEGDEGFALSPP